MPLTTGEALQRQQGSLVRPSLYPLYISAARNTDILHKIPVAALVGREGTVSKVKRLANVSCCWARARLQRGMHVFVRVVRVVKATDFPQLLALAGLWIWEPIALQEPIIGPALQ